MWSIGRKLIRIGAVVYLCATAACAAREIVLGEPLDASVSRPDVVPDVATAGVGGTQSSSDSAGAAGTSDSETAGIAATAGAGGSTGVSMSLGSAGQAGTNPVVGPIGPARPSTGCSNGVGPMDTVIAVGAMRANYRLDLPPAYDSARAYPLIMAFRQENTTVEAFRETLKLQDYTASDAIVVYPDCLNQAAFWDVQRDLALYEALLPKLAGEYCIDQDRVFAVGYGSGALFVNALGCIRSDELRAIAPLSGAPRPAGACDGQTAVWMLQDSSDVSTLESSRGNRNFWARQSACDVTMFEPVDPSPCVQYLGCESRVPVRYCEYAGDGTLPSFVGGGVWGFFSGL